MIEYFFTICKSTSIKVKVNDILLLYMVQEKLSFEDIHNQLDNISFISLDNNQSIKITVNNNALS